MVDDFDIYSDDSLKDAASTAYAQVCAPYHSWTVRTAVAAGMYALPTRDQLLMRLDETSESASFYHARRLSCLKYIHAYINVHIREMDLVHYFGSYVVTFIQIYIVTQESSLILISWSPKRVLDKTNWNSLFDFPFPFILFAAI